MMATMAEPPDRCAPRIDTRERLLLVAIRLFAERGIDRVALSTISDEAGNRNRSAVGYHFENKQGLISAVLRRIESELGAPMDAALADFERRLDAGDPLSVDDCVPRLLAPVFALYSNRPYGSDALRVLARIMHDPVTDVPRHLRRSTGARVDRTVAILQRLLPDKPGDDVELQVHHSVMATVNGLAVDGTGLTDHLITMTKNKKGTIVKASTSALDVTGHAFGVTWVSN